MSGRPIPTIHHLPPGIEQLRRTVFAGASSVDAVRASKACRAEAMRQRRRLGRGEIPPEWVERTEETVVSLTLMEGALATLCGVLREAERREALAGDTACPAPFVTAGEACTRVVAAMAVAEVDP